MTYDLPGELREFFCDQLDRFADLKFEVADLINEVGCRFGSFRLILDPNLSLPGRFFPYEQQVSIRGGQNLCAALTHELTHALLFVEGFLPWAGEADCCFYMITQLIQDLLVNRRLIANSGKRPRLAELPALDWASEVQENARALYRITEFSNCDESLFRMVETLLLEMRLRFADPDQSVVTAMVAARNEAKRHWPTYTDISDDVYCFLSTSDFDDPCKWVHVAQELRDRLRQKWGVAENCCPQPILSL